MARGFAEPQPGQEWRASSLPQAGRGQWREGTPPALLQRGTPTHDTSSPTLLPSTGPAQSASCFHGVQSGTVKRIDETPSSSEENNIGRRGIHLERKGQVPLLYINVCQGEGTLEAGRERAQSLQSKGQGPAYRLVYILHYAAGERKSIELSAVQCVPAADVPISGCCRRMLQIKNQGRGERG